MGTPYSFIEFDEGISTIPKIKRDKIFYPKAYRDRKAAQS
jgi:hypothetical protein